MKKSLSSAALVVAALVMTTAETAQAIPAVTGDVSFDPTTQLYTYTYTIDSSLLTGGSILFGVRQNIAVNYTSPLPTSHTDLDGFNFSISSSAGSSGPPTSISGSYWSWWSQPGATFDEDLVFSFTTTRGVSTDPNNNFILYSDGYTGGPPGLESLLDYGRIVSPALVNIAPDMPVVVPEPSAALLLLAGLMPVAWMGSRKKRQTTS